METQAEGEVEVPVVIARDHFVNMYNDLDLLKNEGPYPKNEDIEAMEPGTDTYKEIRGAV